MGKTRGSGEAYTVAGLMISRRLRGQDHGYSWGYRVGEVDIDPTLNRLESTPTSGEVLVDGEDILSLQLKTAALICRQPGWSWLFQKFALFPPDRLENIGRGPFNRGQSLKKYESEAQKWLARVGLRGRAINILHSCPAGCSVVSASRAL